MSRRGGRFAEAGTAAWQYRARYYLTHLERERSSVIGQPIQQTEYELHFSRTRPLARQILCNLRLIEAASTAGWHVTSLLATSRLHL